MHRQIIEQQRTSTSPYFLARSHFRLTPYQGLTYLLVASKRKGIQLKNLAQLLSLKVSKVREIIRVARRHRLISVNGRIRVLKPRLNKVDVISEALDNVLHRL